MDLSDILTQPPRFLNACRWLTRCQICTVIVQTCSDIFARRCTSSKSLTISFSITKPPFSTLFRLDTHDFLMHVDGVRKTRDVKFVQSSCRHFQIFLHIDVRVVSLSRLVTPSLRFPVAMSGWATCHVLPKTCSGPAGLRVKQRDASSRLSFSCDFWTATPKYEPVNFCFSPPVQALTVSKS